MISPCNFTRFFFKVWKFGLRRKSLDSECKIEKDIFLKSLRGTEIEMQLQKWFCSIVSHQLTMLLLLYFNRHQFWSPITLAFFSFSYLFSWAIGSGWAGCAIAHPVLSNQMKYVYLQMSFSGFVFTIWRLRFRMLFLP